MSSSSSSTSAAPAFGTRSAGRAGAGRVGANAEGRLSAEERALAALFAEEGRPDVMDGMAFDVMKGSELATSLVTKQCATSLANSAKALIGNPQWLPGLVFILVDESEAGQVHMVWQVAEFHDTTQTVVARRVSEHAQREIAEQVSFSLSMVEVLIAPTLPFLERMLATMGASREVAMAKFPIVGNITTVSFGKWNLATNAMEFDLLHVDGTLRNKLRVGMSPTAGATITGTLEGQDSTRRVKTVPSGTHHWFLCDECMLVGSRSEEIVYSAMIHGGARSKPGEPLQLDIGLYLRMTPKEARNLLSLRITSSASFDSITESELTAMRYGTDKTDAHRWQIGEEAMLGYRRVRQCQEILFRLFMLKPYVMERWSHFAEQILDIIENGSERFPGIARNGVINKYVDNVLQAFFAQVHAPGLTAVLADATLASLRLDVTSSVFMRYQMDAEMAQRGFIRGGLKRELDLGPSAPARAPGGVATGEPDNKKGKTQKAFCFSFFTVEGCARGEKCRFSHLPPVTDKDKSVVREGIRAKKATIRPDAF